MFKKYDDLDELKLNIYRKKMSLDLIEVAPSEALLTTIANNMVLPMASEKAKCEFFITPILTEIIRKNLDKVTFFSGYEFNVEKSMGLKGRCDYLITRIPNSPRIQAPVLSVVEAKDDNFEKGIPQCIAQMYAARLFNDRKGKPTPVIFGASSFGLAWQFLQLENDTVTIDTNFYGLERLSTILGTLQYIIDYYDKH
jgi:hypothetical protein